MKYCMIETAFENKEEAEKTIKTLLEKKLVASCQIVESESKWNWKKEYEESKEYLVFMKTKKKKLSLLPKCVKHFTTAHFMQALPLPTAALPFPTLWDIFSPKTTAYPTARPAPLLWTALLTVPPFTPRKSCKEHLK